MLPRTTPILIVDDSAILRNQLRSLLDSLGYVNVVEAVDGLEALAKLTESRVSKATFGLVISDWYMPGLNGIELFKMLKGVPEWTNIPFIFLTAHNSVDDVVTAVAAGIQVYMVKPFTKESLQQKIEAIHRKMMTSGNKSAS